jgi:hypothetical protein
MSSVITVSLDKNPELRDLVEDLQPGAKVYSCLSLRYKDDQSVQLRIEEVARTRDELPDKPESGDDEDGERDSEDEGVQTDGSNEEESDEAEELADGY